MQLNKSVSKLKKEELRAIKFELLALLRKGFDNKQSVVISAKKLDNEGTFAGQYDPNTRTIIINPDSPLYDSIKYFLHENIHALFTELPERSVYALAKKIFADLTVKEREEVFKIMAAESKWDD